jgi:hypothetical protein
MAGGPNAAAVPCFRCAGRAERTGEGQEDDRYRCTACGLEFGIDWAYTGPPDHPRWPPGEEEAARIRQAWAMMHPCEG